MTRRLRADPSTLGRGARGDRADRARLHREPVRARALRGDPAHRRGHPGRRRRRRRDAPRRRRTRRRVAGRGRQGRRGLRDAEGRGRRGGRATTTASCCLIQRADSGVWLYPTGWCDVGYSAAEVVTKEVAEETGIEVEPVRLIGVLDGLRLGMSRIPLYSLLFLCRAVGGELRAAPARVHGPRVVHRVDAPEPARRLRAVGRAGVRRAARRACATSTTTRCADPCGGASRDDPRRARRRRRRRAGRARSAASLPQLSETAPRPRGERPRDGRDLARDDAARRPRRRRARSSGC